MNESVQETLATATDTDDAIPVPDDLFGCEVTLL